MKKKKKLIYLVEEKKNRKDGKYSLYEFTLMHQLHSI